MTWSSMRYLPSSGGKARRYSSPQAPKPKDEGMVCAMPASAAALRRAICGSGWSRLRRIMRAVWEGGVGRVVRRLVRVGVEV